MDHPRGEDNKGLWLWLDDIRLPPWGYDLWAKTAQEAIDFLQLHGGQITHCSLDHDLADEHYNSSSNSGGGYMAPVLPLDRSSYTEMTGYAVLDWMHEHDQWVPDISVHTMNPKGRQDMLAKLRNRAPSWCSWRSCMPPAPAPLNREEPDDT